MTNTVINVIKLNVIENTGIHNVVNPKNNANPEPNVALLANPNVKPYLPMHYLKLFEI